MNNVITSIALSLALLLAPAFASCAEEATSKPPSHAKPRMTKAAVEKIAAEVAKKNGVPSEYVQGDASIDIDLLPRLKWWVFFGKKKGPAMDCYIVWVEDATGKATFLPCERPR